MMLDMFRMEHYLNQLRSGILWMGAHKPDPVFPLDGIEPSEEFREIHRFFEIFSVGIDILTEEENFLIALFDKTSDLGFNGFRGTAAFSAADIRHDTVGTEVVAPIFIAGNPLSKEDSHLPAILQPESSSENSIGISVSDKSFLSVIASIFEIIFIALMIIKNSKYLEK